MSLFSGKNDVTIDKCPFSIDGWENLKDVSFLKSIWKDSILH